MGFFISLAPNYQLVRVFFNFYFMKKIIAICWCFLFICSTAFAVVSPTLTLKGWLVDNTCVAKHKADMASFVEVHDMSCARSCGKTSGFSLYSGGKLYPFAKSETSKIIKYFGADFHNDTKVLITAKNSGSKLKPVLKILTIKANKK